MGQPFTVTLLRRSLFLVPWRQIHRFPFAGRPLCLSFWGLYRLKEVYRLKELYRLKEVQRLVGLLFFSAAQNVIGFHLASAAPSPNQRMNASLRSETLYLYLLHASAYFLRTKRFANLPGHLQQRQGGAPFKLGDEGDNT